MKKANPIPADDMRAEYDFASMKGGVRSKYARHRTSRAKRKAKAGKSARAPRD